jgi:transcriptional regulator with XRE-family HTH domain
MEKKQVQHKDNFADIAALLHRLPSAFPETLVVLMNWRRMTKNELAEAALTEPRTLQRLRNGVSRPSLETVFALCIGLRLPVSLSFVLIKKAGYAFQPTIQHVVYQDLLAKAYLMGMSLRDVNAELETAGLMAIGDE